jgi:hypothetical protein
MPRREEREPLLPAPLAERQLLDGTGVGEPVPADTDGVGVAEPLVGDGAGDDGAGDELVAGLLLVGDGLAVGEAVGVAAGDGDVAGWLTLTVGAGTGIGSVVLGGEFGNSAMTGTVGAGLCCAAGAAGVAGAVVAGMARPGWLRGATAALSRAAALGAATRLAGAATRLAGAAR